MTKRKPKSEWGKPGRPKVENPRCRILALRLTRGEEAEVRKAAKANGVRLQDYLRGMIFGKGD